MLQKPIGRLGWKEMILFFNRILIKSEDSDDEEFYEVATIAKKVLRKIMEKNNMELRGNTVQDMLEEYEHQKLDGLNMTFDEYHRIVVHPVHILDENNEMSPSAFIPFCEFGGNISLMGQNHPNFSFPICNSFKKAIHKDRIW